MTGYTKLFNSILGSTIWREDPITKVAWITMLAMADCDGVVEASIPGLAHFAGVTLADTEAAVQKLLSPDPYSRSPEYDGRRIEPVDGGWRLLNHDKYREKLSKEDMRDSNPHFLDWANQPAPFKIYPALEPLSLPREVRQTGVATLRSTRKTRIVNRVATTESIRYCMVPGPFFPANPQLTT
jgi:hypothetical protein